MLEVYLYSHGHSLIQPSQLKQVHQLSTMRSKVSTDGRRPRKKRNINSYTTDTKMSTTNSVMTKPELGEKLKNQNFFHVI